MVDKISLHTFDSRYHKRSYTDGVLTSDQILGGILSYTDEVHYEDVPKRDYRKLIKEGLDATTEANGIKKTGKAIAGETYVEFHHNFANVDLIERTSGFITQPSGGVAESYDSSLDSSVLASFIQEARAVQHQFQAGVFLGELTETINLLRRPYSLFRNATRRYHKRAKELPFGRNSASSVRKKLANEYLQYTFGIVPLLYDVDDAMYDLATLSVGKPPMAYVKKSGRSRKVRSVDSEQSFQSYWAKRRLEVQVYEQSVTYRGKIRCLIPSFDAPTSNTLRVALSDFVPTLYELIPYSFLLDYFVNIGDIVNAVTFLNSSVSWCNRTRRSSVVSTAYEKYRFTAQNSGALTILHHSEKPSQSEERSTIFDRKRVTNFVPDLTFTLPGFGSKKWLNMGALLAQSRSVF